MKGYQRTTGGANRILHGPPHIGPGRYQETTAAARATRLPAVGPSLQRGAQDAFDFGARDGGGQLLSRLPFFADELRHLLQVLVCQGLSHPNRDAPDGLEGLARRRISIQEPFHDFPIVDARVVRLVRVSEQEAVFEA